MITVKDIKEKIEAFAPKSLCMENDNVGLLVGSYNKKVNKILVALDADEKVCLEAIKEGVDLIITHHPVMFHATKHLTDETPMERMLRLLVANDISLYAAHTNLDCAKGGINDLMAEKMGMKDTEVLEEVYSEKGISEGYGRYSYLKEPVTFKDVIKRYKEAFSVDVVRYVGDLDTPIRRLAVNTGGGAFALEEVFSKGIDLLITGDFKYNQLRDAYERNVCIIDAFHYDSEKIAMEFFEKFIKENFPETEVIKSKENISIINYHI